MAQPHVYLTKSDVARRHIQGMILSGAVRSGDRITTREVSEALGISETPIREAIRSLASEGWLEVQTHVGAVVARFGGEQVQEIYALRGLIGGLAIEFGGPFYDAARLANIDANIEAAEVAVANSDVELYAKLNNEFHVLLCDTPASQWCFKILVNLRAQTSIQQGFAAVPARLPGSLAEHRLIRDAIRQQDFGRAAELVKQHEHAAGAALINALTAARDAFVEATE
ncbi:GntR family transcriptional regulator [Arvimicrobium flavum]|uniref:GntR family transcriptional regulator n=1 Tax=Arvimicrobium flavum TaxID=3393320 RepID=UPI00237AE0BF|nr:GntR family transcriptional regulator [Mesorhizobium shangrilense]